VSGTHLGPTTNFSPSLFIYFLNCCGFVDMGPPLSRSRVCSFQFLPGIASATFLRSESHRTHKHILLSLFLRLPKPGGPGSCIYFLQEQVAQLYPWVEIEVKLQPTVSLGVRHPSRTCKQFFFLLEIFFRQLQICYFVAPFLTRGQVCNLLLLLVLASAVPRDLTIFYYSNS
jgi:hypothetical protein